MERIKIEGIEINYERKGKGKTKIFFLHGNSCSMRFFDKQFNDEKLLNNFELIRFDFPGHGLSSYANNTDTYSYLSFANIFHKFYETLKIENTFVVCNSFSGNVILEIIEKLQGIKGIMLQGTVPFGLGIEMYNPHPNLSLFFKGELTKKDIKSISEIVFYNPEYYNLLSSEVKKTDPKFRESIFSNLEKFSLKNQIEIIKQLKIPIAIINGKEEEIINFEYIKAVPFNNLWKKEILFIPKTKHFPFLENPIMFNEYLFEFCNQK